MIKFKNYIESFVEDPKFFSYDTIPGNGDDVFFHFSNSSNKSSVDIWRNIIDLDERLSAIVDAGYRKFHIVPEMREWFIQNYPEYMDYIHATDQETKKLKDKYSHLRMGGKFGMFKND